MSNIRNLDFDKYLSVQVPKPPIKIQQEIVAECEAVDVGTERAKQTIEQNKQAIASRVQAIISANYPTKQLGDSEVAVIRKGTSITETETTDGNIKVVAGGVSHAYLHGESNRPENTITISASGANAGYVNYWQEPIFASDCSTINSKEGVLNFYLFCVLRHTQDDIFKLARGAGQPHVYPDDIAEIKIPVPPLPIQQKLVAEVKKLESKIADAQAILDKATERKNAILKKHLEVKPVRR